MTNKELEALFSQNVHNAIKECHRLNYHPTRIEEMLKVSNPVYVAKKFVVSSKIQYGLKKLKSLGRLELSFENMILDPIFYPIFTNAERQAAAFRLSQV